MIHKSSIIDNSLQITQNKIMKYVIKILGDYKNK